MADVVFVCTPIAIPDTFTENVQLAPAAKVAPVKLMLFEAGTALIVPPPHEPISPFGVETISPPGNVSLNAMPVNAPAFGFVMVKLKAVLLPGPNS